jgi:TonB family protein
MQFYWTPETEHRVANTPLTVRTRLARFFTLSTAAHVAGAAAATWLSIGLLPPRPAEELLVRTIDFVEPPPRPAAPGGNRREPTGGAGASVVRAARPSAPARAPGPVRPAAPAAPAPAQAPAPAPAPAPASAPASGDLPTPSPEETRLAAATPRAIGGGTARGPAAVAAPPRDSGPSAAPAILASVGSGDAPQATVALPPGLVRGNGSGGVGSASGVGTGNAAGGGAGTAGAGGGTGVDLGDPDFSEYFRLIERRVRAAWKFPESLGGTTQTVKIGFALAAEGSLREARVVSSSSGTLNDSALSAMQRAAPFPPLPTKFRALAGQPLVMSFTVTIK